MGLPSRKHDHAWHRHGSCRGNDRGKAPSRLCPIRSSANSLVLVTAFFLSATSLWAEGVRIATLHAELTRKGPGLLLRDINRGEDTQITAVATLTESVAADVLLLTKVDFDAELRIAQALAQLLGYRHVFALPPNSMTVSDYDLNGDGRMGDRQAWARYAGEGGMLLLSKLPITPRFHLNDLLWVDAAQAPQPLPDSLSDQAQARLKLVTQGFWVVDIQWREDVPLTLVAFQNTTPLFDGEEDLNGRRNEGQLSLLGAVMDGKYGAFPDSEFVLLGNANLDPQRGEGARDAMAKLLSDPRLQDAEPGNEAGGTETVVWEKAGPMRVSYILPSADWQVVQAKLVKPKSGPLRLAAEQASRHLMVWMDIKRPSR